MANYRLLVQNTNYQSNLSVLTYHKAGYYKEVIPQSERRNYIKTTIEKRNASKISRCCFYLYVTFESEVFFRDASPFAKKLHVFFQPDVNI